MTSRIGSPTSDTGNWLWSALRTIPDTISRGPASVARYMATLAPSRDTRSETMLDPAGNDGVRSCSLPAESKTWIWLGLADGTVHR